MGVGVTYEHGRVGGAKVGVELKCGHFTRTDCWDSNYHFVQTAYGDPVHGREDHVDSPTQVLLGGTLDQVIADLGQDKVRHSSVSTVGATGDFAVLLISFQLKREMPPPLSLRHYRISSNTGVMWGYFSELTSLHLPHHVMLHREQERELSNQMLAEVPKSRSNHHLRTFTARVCKVMEEVRSLQQQVTLQEVLAEDPFYGELAAQLPVTLDPNGSDQYLFFIVPIQKSDDMNVVVQVAQVQEGSYLRNDSRAVITAEAENGDVNVSSIVSPDLSLDDVFRTGEEDIQPEFNFQVPVVVPLNFPFRYDPGDGSPPLPNCAVDSRTWMENIISKIATTMDLDYTPEWDHSDLTLRIRLLKDTLAATSVQDLSTSALLATFLEKVMICNALAGTRTSAILQNIDSLTANYGGIVSEAVDTYRLLQQSLAIASTAVQSLPHDAAVDIADAQINIVSPSVNTILTQLEAAYELVRELQSKEEE
ncbi:uncharacterized protein LOC134762846 [Penaeus indicus]|uniref:uncharacterized protein LOC134762846 n=1 Tax=Penaeus indicus TaxID=29960 RepID=UPI00300C97D8